MALRRVSKTSPWCIGGWRPLTITTLTTESLLEPLSNPGSPILHDLVINDLDDEPVILEADPVRRLGAFEFILKKSFYDRRHFCRVLKEFAISNKFELEHIKTDSQIVKGKCLSKSCTWCVCATVVRGTQDFVMQKFCNEHTCNTSKQKKKHRKPNLDG